MDKSKFWIKKWLAKTVCIKIAKFGSFGVMHLGVLSGVRSNGSCPEDHFCSG